MWNGLDAIAWGELRHNYGPASDVPELLRRCRADTADDAVTAFNELDNNLYHQGGWVCSAATAALPFLVDLVTTPGHSLRSHVLHLIDALADEARTVHDDWVDPGWPTAWRSAIDGLRPLANDEDAEIRRLVTRLMTYLVGDERASALLERWHSETEPGTRLDIVVALGSAMNTVEGPASRESIMTLLSNLSTGDDPQFRFAALRARVEAGGVAEPSDTEIPVGAIRAPDANRWAHATTGGDHLGLATTAAKLFDDGAAQIAVVTGLAADGATVEVRRAAAHVAAIATMHRRSVTTSLLPTLGRLLADPDAECRARALHMLACIGAEAVDHADEVTALFTDEGQWRRTSNADIALWAATRFEDRRSLPSLTELITTGRPGFTHSNMFWGDRTVSSAIPGLTDVLAPLGEWADELLPAIRARLGELGAADEAEIRALAGVLAEWGDRAAPAVGELAALLPVTTEPILAALGAIGPAASGVTLPPVTDVEGDRLRHHLAITHYRISGDPTIALDVLGSAVDAGDRFAAVEWLGELGQPAGGHVPALSRLLDAGDEWGRARAAASLWSITGDATRAVPVLASTLDGLRDGRVLPVMRFAVGRLARIGSAAAPAVPLVRALVEGDERLAYFGGWRVFTEDEAFRAAADRLFAAVA
ncbi:hypothetical protein [Stackebrandtia soli]|uniref:hypothetical protein n=1 Tax=Stackebrandtia soli TaxID=1892856 RepID=UPI0039EC188A